MCEQELSMYAVVKCTGIQINKSQGLHNGTAKTYIDGHTGAWILMSAYVLAKVLGQALTSR